MSPTELFIYETTQLPVDIISWVHLRQLEGRRLSKLAADRFYQNAGSRCASCSSYILGVRFERGLWASKHEPRVGVGDPVALPACLGHGHWHLGRGEEEHLGHLESCIYGQLLQDQMQRFDFEGDKEKPRAPLLGDRHY